MTRYYNLRIHYTRAYDGKEAYDDYNLLTREMLNATMRAAEENYNSGVYTALRIEYYIVQ